MEVQFQSIQHTFRDKTPREALREINCRIPDGQFTALVGPSGCGKSTLLRLCANLLKPTAGQILLDKQSPVEIVQQQRLAWMSQSPALLPWKTVEQNAAAATRFQKREKPPRLTAWEALEMVGLSDAREAYPDMLSGGMQQRLALARTLTLNADLWLMDEPFAALDELTRERLTVELMALWQPLRPTVLWVTHHLHEAIRLADRILVMSPAPGRIIADAAVNLPRPRRETNPEYQALLQQLRDVLNDST
jgi:NitT/TauT family transport system ATP-binding protein